MGVVTTCYDDAPQFWGPDVPHGSSYSDRPLSPDHRSGMHNRTRGKLLRRNVSAICAQYGRNMGAMWVVGKVRTGQTLTSFVWTDY